MLKRFRKGEIPAKKNVFVATSWDEFEPEDYNPAEDGDDNVHDKTMHHLIPHEKLTTHLREQHHG